MKNSEKIIEMLTNYSNCYNLDKKLKSMVLENNKSTLKVSFPIEYGYKNPIKIEFDICIKEKDDCIEETTNYTAHGINVSVKCKYFKYENFDEWELYGNTSEVILTNEKKEKHRIFIDYKKNICCYTSNIKGLELKQYYKPNNGSNLETYISERYIRTNSFVYGVETLEKELKKVEEHFYNSLTGEVVVYDWEDYEPSLEEEMEFLQNKSSGRTCLYLDEK